MDTFRLTTDDGIALEADMAMTTEAHKGAAVICHPHPLYGGDRRNAVVAALFDRLPAAGYHALRFDFRRADADGVAERLDVAAALAAMRQRTDGAPLALVGYSFGAMVSLGMDDPDLCALAAIAPPVSAGSAPPGVSCPIGLFVPEHDEFAPPATVDEAMSTWPPTTREMATVEVIGGAGHFLTGAVGAVTGSVVSWLDGLLGA